MARLARVRPIGRHVQALNPKQLWCPVQQVRGHVLADQDAQVEEVAALQHMVGVYRCVPGQVDSDWLLSLHQPFSDT